MPVGDYHVWVTNPDNLSDDWTVTDQAGVFTVTDTPPPTISGIDPVQSPFNVACDPFTVSGAHFQSDAEVWIVTPDGEADIQLTVSSASDTELVAAIPAETVEIGLYPIRVVNPSDGQSDTFYVFEAKNNTDGHFDGDFSELDTVFLQTARERLALEFGFDIYGGTHLYASGGIDDLGSVLDTTERASVNIYGEVGGWQTLQQWSSEVTPRQDNLFNYPRQAHAMVRAGGWLYAIGGNGDNTSDFLEGSFLALYTVERAKILGTEEMPEVSPPTRVGDGDLPTGTWYYRVSSLGDWGEGIASDEVQILNTGGSLEVCFDKVENATGYNIYRSLAADGRPGTGRLVATMAEQGEGDSMCFVDDGSSIPAPGFLSATTQDGGALAPGTWIYRVSSVGAEESAAGYAVSVTTGGAGDNSVKLNWGEVPGATSYNVYRTLTEVSEVTGSEMTYLVAEGVSGTEWIDDGSAGSDGGVGDDAGVSGDDETAAPEGVRPLPIGSLSRWSVLDSELDEAREGLGAVIVALPNEASVGADAGVDAGTESGDPWHEDYRLFIYVAGGRPHGGGNEYLNTIERAEIYANGDLSPWEISEADSLEPTDTGRAFFPLLSSQRREMSPVASWPAESDLTDPIFLFAVAGDESFASPGYNSGLTTLKAAEVEAPDGTLGKWVAQTVELSEGRKTYAHGGVTVDEYLYCFTGVNTEKAGTNPTGVGYELNPLASGSTRFVLFAEDLHNPDYDNVATGGHMSSNGAIELPRAYYGMVRVNSHIYIVGGNDGDGPLDSMESIRQ
jgi:hypothetical protein